MLAFLRTARPLAAATAASVLLVGCGDDDPAGPRFSEETANQVAAVAEDVVAPMDATVEVQMNLANAMFALSGVSTAPMAPMQPFSAINALRRPLAAARALPIPSAPSGVLIPDEWEGTTFVWSSAEEMYVASDLNGAPASGIRFVYYAVDPVSGYPAEPLNDLGHIDLIDASTATRSRLEIVAVRDQGDVTLADYFVEGGVSGNLATQVVTIDSEGFFSDGSDRLDFDMGMTLTSTGEEEGTIVMDVDLSANGGAIDAHFEDSVDGDLIETETSFTIEGGGNEATFAYTTSGNEFEATIDGALTFNGREAVVVTGDAYDPEFTQPDGSPLTADEIDALVRMWAAIGMTGLFVLQTLFPFLLLLSFASM